MSDYASCEEHFTDLFYGEHSDRLGYADTQWWIRAEGQPWRPATSHRDKATLRRAIEDYARTGWEPDPLNGEREAMRLRAKVLAGNTGYYWMRRLIEDLYVLDGWKPVD